MSVEEHTVPVPKERFNYEPGRIINGKYLIQEKLGGGSEGEVFRVIERNTGIVRTAKFFYPSQNKRNHAAVRYAKLLHQLSECPSIVHYHTHEIVKFKKQEVTCLISEYVEGDILGDYILKQPGKRIPRSLCLHLLHDIICCLEFMHAKKIVHGDIHSDNVIIKRYGLGFSVKILDLHWWGNKQTVSPIDDIYGAVKVFHEALGGTKHYSNHPQEIKAICLGLKRVLIKKQYKSAAILRNVIETIEWSNVYKE